MQAAEGFPHIVRWFLVEQYTDQHKMVLGSNGTSEKQTVSRSGPRSVEVEINGLYAPIHDASSFTHVVDLSARRKRLQGQVFSLPPCWNEKYASNVEGCALTPWPKTVRFVGPIYSRLKSITLHGLVSHSGIPV